MNFGFENNKFFVEHEPCLRPVLPFIDECKLRANSLVEENKNIVLTVSTGLDSQIAVHSFASQSLPITYVFFKQAGFNAEEFTRLIYIETKYNIKIEVLDIDPLMVKEEVLYLATELDIHPNHALHHVFCKQLPYDHTIVQAIHDPWFITKKTTNEHYIYHGYYDPEIARLRALNAIPHRTAPARSFGDSSEFFMSLITDSIYANFLTSSSYFDGNKLQLDSQKMHDVFRYDYYIKPLIYAKHWKNELLYFPKFKGYDNIDWIRDFPIQYVYESKHHCFIPYMELIQFFSDSTAVKRYYA